VLLGVANGMRSWLKIAESLDKKVFRQDYRSTELGIYTLSYRTSLATTRIQPDKHKVQCHKSIAT